MTPGKEKKPAAISDGRLLFRGRKKACGRDATLTEC
jgi:hypothetical protein